MLVQRLDLKGGAFLWFQIGSLENAGGVFGSRYRATLKNTEQTQEWIQSKLDNQCQTALRHPLHCEQKLFRAWIDLNDVVAKF